MKTINGDKKLMEVLKVSELRHHIATTEKGELCMCLRYGEDKYFFTLDSVPCEKDINDDLIEMTFPKEQVVPQVVKKTSAVGMSTLAPSDPIVVVEADRPE